MTPLAEALRVFLVQGAVLVLPPLLPVRYLLRKASWSETVCCSLAMGLAVQSVLGFLWNNGPGCCPRAEAAVYYALWGVLAAVTMAVRKGRGDGGEPPRGEDGALLLVLLVAAVAVRLVHPLQTAVLGQSDAYSHLQFLQDVVSEGRLRNIVYPPGYSWVMALPAVTFSLDPYDLARFGGAFFGGALVLAVYVLTRSVLNREAALLSGLLVAVFPGLNMLQKTGVGAFANQLGLFFVPVILWLLLSALKSGFLSRTHNTFLSLALAGMASSVPVMMLHLVWVALPALLAALVWKRISFRKTWWRAVLVALPAMAIFFSQAAGADDVHREITVKVMTGKSTVEKPGARSAEAKPDEPTLKKAAADYFSIKRLGVHDRLFNLAGAGLFLLFAGWAAAALSRRDTGALLAASWGLVTSIQSLTGWLQFSQYQREGWSFMLATAVLSGAAWGWLCGAFRRPLAARTVYAAAGLSFFLWTLLHPPAHQSVISSAEEEIVRICRYVFAGSSEMATSAGVSVRSHLDGGEYYVMARRFSGFSGGQGDVIQAVLGPVMRKKVISVHQARQEKYMFKKKRRYVVFLDRQPDLASRDPGAYERLNPAQAERFTAFRERAYRVNEKIEKSIRRAAAAGRDVTRVDAGEFLEVVIVH